MMKRKLSLLPLLLIAALLLVGVVSAQGNVTATVLGPEAPYTANVGDPLELTLVVTHPAGYQVIAPELDDQADGTSWGDFVIRSQSPPTTADNGDGTETTIIVFDARLFAPGEFSTPPLPVTVTDGAGQLIEVTAAPVPVTITSVLVEGDTELRDIKPQAEMPFTNLLPWLAGGLLLALLAGGAYLFYRWRQERLALAAVDNRLPHEIALDELDRIARLGLPERKLFKEHYSMVSDTVRIYLESIYAVPVMERTTGEIASELQATTLDRGTQRRVVTFLQESDLVKFADIVPSEAEAYELIAQGRMIVESTKPLTISPDDLNGSSGLNGGSPDAVVAARAFSSNGQNDTIEVSA
ncbi:MAG: hypothetical protein ACK2U5_09260 [Candidatus Promineifilaceae bacterium]|jgi:hypothetical protein